MHALSRLGTRQVVVLLVVAMVAAACAGEVGKYRDVAAGGDEFATSDLNPQLDPQHLDPQADAVGGDAGDIEVEPSAEPDIPSDAAPDPDPSASTGEGPSEAPPPTGPATSSPSTTAGADKTGITPTQVAVGLVYPNTGLYAPLARSWPDVLQAAFDEVNDQGGIHGRNLVLKTYDDAGSDANTIAANHRRARDEVFAYISYISTTNEILAPLANKDGVPILYGNIPEELGQTLRYGFAGIPYWATQARIMPSFIANRLDGSDKRIGVTFEDSQTAINAKDIFKSEAAQAGLDVVFEQPVQANQSTCANEVANLQSNRVELVVMIHGPFAAICMQRDAQALGYDATWTGMGSVLQTNTLPPATGGGADGMSVLASITTLET